MMASTSPGRNASQADSIWTIRRVPEDPKQRLRRRRPHASSRPTVAEAVSSEGVNDNSALMHEVFTNLGSIDDDDVENDVCYDMKEETIELPTSCPVCRKPFKQVLCHIKSKEHCKKNIHPDELKRLENIRDNNKRIKNRERKARNRKLNPEKAKEQMQSSPKTTT